LAILFNNIVQLGNVKVGPGPVPVLRTMR